MLATVPWFRGEAFPPIVEDLLRLPAGTRIVAEGFRLPPRLVVPLLPAPRAAGRLPRFLFEGPVLRLPTAS